MSDLPATKLPDYGEIMESVVIKGDLGKLSAAERAQYYVKVCESVGLNPMTQPFEYIVLNGKLQLYARKAATDQLRQTYKISLTVVDQKLEGDLMVVRVQARDPSGRVDEDMGVVPLGNLKGEARSNAMMKAITKAKRRVTLSFCGLGFLDETEIGSIPGARHEIPAKEKMQNLAAQLAASVPAADMPPEIDVSAGDAGEVAATYALPAVKSECYMRIDACQSIDELMGVADLIRSVRSEMDPADLADVRGAWQAKKEAMEATFFEQLNADVAEGR